MRSAPSPSCSRRRCAAPALGEAGVEPELELGQGLQHAAQHLDLRRAALSASRSATYSRVESQCAHSARATVTGSLPSHSAETIGR